MNMRYIKLSEDIFFFAPLGQTGPQSVTKKNGIER